MIRGNFIEDMEQLQSLYEERFTHYSCEYHFNGKVNARVKMLDYKNCVEKMKKVITFINNL